MFIQRSHLYLLLLLLLSTFAAAQDVWQEQGAKLAVLLQWHPGDTVADVGAGNGELTAIAAERVGLLGKVFSTELDLGKLAVLRELAAKQTNVYPLEASASDTNLPDLSCDSIFLRLVYHHFTNPGAMDSSLFRTLKHGGRLAVIDEEPGKGTTVPEGVPKNRRGHGIPQKLLIRELKHAGFKVLTIDNDWRYGDSSHPMYCVVFLKR